MCMLGLILISGFRALLGGARPFLRKQHVQSFVIRESIRACPCELSIFFRISSWNVLEPQA